jgi:anti-sigma factor RsiW
MTDPRGDTVTHLSPEAMAGYLDDDLTREEWRQAELHLVSCPECRQEWAEVRRLQRDQRRRRWVPLLVPAVAAAALLLILALPRHTPTPSDTRSGPHAEPQLGVVAPAPLDQVGPGPITFIWRSAAPDASYTLTLQEADGHVVWSTALTDTVAVSPDSLALAPERTWFWFVDALLPNGRSLSTGVHRLRTRP